jgi:exopolysaccharide biosynthesis polyprenyl glycosylphosphotransferase
VVLSCHWQHLYRRYQRRSNLEIVIAMARSCLMATTVLVALLYVSHIVDISRLVVFGMFLTAFVTGSSWRLFRRRMIAQGVKSGVAGRNVLIVGARETGRSFAAYLRTHSHFGYRVVGFLDPLHGPEVLGDIAEVRKVVLSSFVDEVIVSSPCAPNTVHYLASELAGIGTGLSVVPETYSGLGFNSPIEMVGSVPLMVLYNTPINSLEVMIKRVIDCFVSGFLLFAALPMLAAIAMAVRLDSKGPIFYSSDRVGKRGRIFSCYKFRTMVSNAEQLRSSLVHLNERDGILFKIKNDPRITKVGRFLRKYSLDELPQLWNVFVGDMSLVGPRPALPSEVRDYSPEHVRRMMVMPGITGLWQVQARDNPSFDAYIDLDLQYVENASLWLDLKILARTVFVVLAGTGS